MNHAFIDQHQVIDRYLMNQLQAEEARRFEKHFLHCQLCLDQLEVAEGFQRGLKRSVAEDVAKVAIAQRLGLLARIASSPRAGLLATVFLLVAALPAGLFFQHSRQLGRDLDLANSTVAELQRTPPPAVTDGGPIYEPQINTALFSMSPERSALITGGEPVHIVRLAAEPEWLVLSLELGLIEHDDYRVVLLRQGREVWNRQGLVPNHLDALMLSLHSSWLGAGDYVARVEAGTDPVAHFSFRVIAAP